MIGSRNRSWRTGMGRRHQKSENRVSLIYHPRSQGHTSLRLAATALEALHKQVLPFLLRRLKEDVLSDLPPKIIQDYNCELSDIQKLLYDEFSRSKAAEDAGETVSSSDDAAQSQPQQHVFQSLQYLRKLCNHPALVLDKDAPRAKELLEKVGSKVGLHDISHAPKMEALKWVVCPSETLDLVPGWLWIKKKMR